MCTFLDTFFLFLIFFLSVLFNSSFAVRLIAFLHKNRISPFAFLHSDSCQQHKNDFHSEQLYK